VCMCLYVCFCEWVGAYVFVCVYVYIYMCVCVCVCVYIRLVLSYPIRLCLLKLFLCVLSNVCSALLLLSTEEDELLCVCVMGMNGLFI